MGCVEIHSCLLWLSVRWFGLFAWGLEFGVFLGCKYGSYRWKCLIRLNVDISIRLCVDEIRVNDI